MDTFSEYFSPYVYPIGVFGLLIVLGIIFYLRSVKSRKSYSCPECKEKVKSEHMDAKRCPMCGAVLKEEEYVE